MNTQQIDSRSIQEVADKMTSSHCGVGGPHTATFPVSICSVVFAGDRRYMGPLSPTSFGMCNALLAVFEMSGTESPLYMPAAYMQQDKDIGPGKTDQ